MLQVVFERTTTRQKDPLRSTSQPSRLNATLGSRPFRRLPVTAMQEAQSGRCAARRASQPLRPTHYKEQMTVLMECL
eukprot:CAMPEP_0118945044 /NCGR_PEP_ID=MMETSP1169-20130426/41514_1 /TAXON_ID=36882 /ORGANISM="Pyramimonas obovata, Strain CCMP722" /LENGTH=76 /DNA_ID=CAMNT_0006890673 /DNA_START=183 /DNA_END=413 /DNA_ORIENTATION=+